MKSPRQRIESLYGKGPEEQGAAYQDLMKETDEPVAWAEDVWDDLLELLDKGDNRGRSIAAQVLCNLAKSDPANRMDKTLPKLIEATKDQQFVTARHSLQALWRVGVVNDALAEQTVDGLARRFEECGDEKNRTLIRYDITCVLRKIHEHTGDERILERSLALIETETDEKYRNKYLREWKRVLKGRE